MDLNSEDLNELLYYDEDTGKLFWKNRDVSWFKNEKAWKIWNTRFSGKEALSTVNGNGYKTGRILRKTYQSHRVIWCMVTGEWPVFVDHINGDTTYNVRSNLRDVSHQDNHKNRKMRINNTTGYTGVYWEESKGKWRVKINNLDGLREDKGHFESFDEAVEVRRYWENQYNYHENHGRLEAQC